MAEEVAQEAFSIELFEQTTPGGGETSPHEVQLKTGIQFFRGGYRGTNVKVKSSSAAFGDVIVRVYADQTMQVELAETKFAFTAQGETLSDLFAGPVPFFSGVWITIEGSVGSITCQILPYITATTDNPF